MTFSELFKSGDIICSDNFNYGICMIVKNFEEDSKYSPPHYSCIDLVDGPENDPQGWHAYEKDTSSLKRNYNWRIATDKDIVNYLLKYFNPQKEGKFEVYENGLLIRNYETVHLNKEEALKLKNYLNKWIQE